MALVYKTKMPGSRTGDGCLFILQR